MSELTRLLSRVAQLDEDFGARSSAPAASVATSGSTIPPALAASVLCRPSQRADAATKGAAMKRAAMKRAAMSEYLQTLRRVREYLRDHITLDPRDFTAGQRLNFAGHDVVVVELPDGQLGLAPARPVLNTPDANDDGGVE